MYVNDEWTNDDKCKYDIDPNSQNFQILQQQNYLLGAIVLLLLFEVVVCFCCWFHSSTLSRLKFNLGLKEHSRPGPQMMSGNINQMNQ